jgi:NAD+ synthase
MVSTPSPDDAASRRLAISQELGVRTEIDVENEIRVRVSFLESYVRKSHCKALVLGMSGGIDSTTAGRLAQLAVTNLLSRRVRLSAW